MTPDSFLGLETGCKDADDYDNVTLTCTASKPSLVVPPLMVRWICDTTVTDGSQPQNDTLGSVTMNSDGTFVTNTLTFRTAPPWPMTLVPMCAMLPWAYLIQTSS